MVGQLSPASSTLVHFCTAAPQSFRKEAVAAFQPAAGILEAGNKGFVLAPCAQDVLLDTALKVSGGKEKGIPWRWRQRPSPSGLVVDSKEGHAHVPGKAQAPHNQMPTAC